MTLILLHGLVIAILVGFLIGLQARCLAVMRTSPLRPQR